MRLRAVLGSVSRRRQLHSVQRRPIRAGRWFGLLHCLPTERRRPVVVGNRMRCLSFERAFIRRDQLFVQQRLRSYAETQLKLYILRTMPSR